MLIIFFGVAVYLCYIWRKAGGTFSGGKGSINDGQPSNEYFERMLDLEDAEEDEEEDNDVDHIHGAGVSKTKDLFHPIVSVDNKTHREMAKAIKKEQKEKEKSEEPVPDEDENQNENDENNDNDNNDTNDDNNNNDKKGSVVIDDPVDPNEVVPGDDEIDYVE